MLWIVSALGTSCWPLSLIPFLFGVVCSWESVCSLLLQHVFPNSAIPPYSSSQVVVPGGVTEQSTQLQAVQEICVLRPKTCFDRLCHIWRDIYSESHSYLQAHDTILLTGSICTPCKRKTYFVHETKKKRKKRSYVAIVNRTLTRKPIWHCQKTRRELSLAIQLKNKRLLYGSYKCATTDTLKKLSWHQHSITVITVSHCNKWKQNKWVTTI